MIKHDLYILQHSPLPKNNSQRDRRNQMENRSIGKSNLNLRKENYLL